MQTGATHISASMANLGRILDIRLTAAILLICGTVAAILGLLAIIGWHTGSTTLIQIAPSFAPMQYNAAIGILVSGAALTAIRYRHIKTGAVLGLFLVLLAGLTLFQYYSGISLGIDQLILKSYITLGTSHPGRMAPNTAVGLLFCGLSFMLFLLARRFPMCAHLAGVLAACTTAIALVALLGYIAGMPTAYGWGSFTQMAVLAALGLAVSGGGIFAAGLMLKHRSDPFQHHWVALLVMVFGGAFTLLVWQALEAQQTTKAGKEFQHIANAYSLSISQELRHYHAALVILASTYENFGIADDQRFREFASEIVTNNSGLVALEWIPLELVPEIDTNSTALHDDSTTLSSFIISSDNTDIHSSLDTISHLKLMRTMAKIRDSGTSEMLVYDYPSGDDKTAKGIKIFTPVYRSRSEASGGDWRRRNLLGYFASSIDIRAIIKQASSHLTPEPISISIMDFNAEPEDRLLYESATGSNLTSYGDHTTVNEFSESHSLNVAGHIWRLQISSTAEFMDKWNTPYPLSTLIGGLCTSLLASLVVFVILRSLHNQHQAQTTLRRYAQALESSNRDLQDFAYISSHDMQEPLRKIQAFCDRLLDKEAANLTATGQDYLTRMRDASGRMRTLIDGLLEYSDVTAKGDTMQETDLQEVLNCVLDELQHSISRSGARIEADPLPIIFADKRQMHLLFLHLLGNALLYTHASNGPLISISAALGNQNMVARLSGEDTLYLSIQDNGIGFDDKYKERIFAPFQRLHRREIYSGTGMGLAVCKKIVERHGGTIIAESTPGQGAKFSITIPLNNSHSDILGDHSDAKAQFK